MKRLTLCLAVSILLASSCAAQDPRGPFADVPTDHWAYQDVDTLQKAGIVFGHPDGTWSFRPMTRQQFVVNTANLLSEMSGAQTPLRAEIETRLRDSPPAISALQDLVRHFKPELVRLTLDVDTVQARLAELGQTAFHPLAAKPFPDVPAGHWAASAVETLRLNGIVAGYPNRAYTVPEGTR